MNKKLSALLGFFSNIFPKLTAKIALYFFSRPVRIARPKSEMAWYESARKSRIKNGIAAFEWGRPDDPLVLLIHGWNGRGTQLASFSESLVKNHFRVVALDGPGHGSSFGNKTNPSHFAQFIIDSQKELLRGTPYDKSRAVIAHSFGGGCTVLALTRGLATDGVVLIASPAFYERVVHFFCKSLNLSKKCEEFFFQLVTKVSGIHPRDLNIGLLGSKLSQAALIVHDEEDIAVDYLSAKAIVEAWPRCQLFTTRGLGHRRILKDHEVIKRVTLFITNLIQ